MSGEILQIHKEDLTKEQLAALEFLDTADRWLGRNDYEFYIREVLGLNFESLNDPRVIESVRKKGQLLNYWRTEGRFNRTYMKVLEVRPRDTVKSTTLTVPAPTYLHLSDPDISVGIMTARMEKMADKFGDAIRSTFEGKMTGCRLTDLYGQFHAPGSNRLWQTERMITDMRLATSRPDPTVAVYSITSGPTSGHFNVFIIDDPIIAELLEKDSRFTQKVWEAYLRMPFVVMRGGLLWIIMTRYGDDDLCGRIIREEIEPAVRARVQIGAPIGELPSDWDYERGWIKYAHLAGWHVLYDSVYEDYDPKTKTGKIVYPVIWPEERIAEVRRTRKGEQHFWTHLMNQPAQREDAPVKAEHIELARMFSLDEVPMQARRCVDIHCDFAFKNLDSYISAKDDRTVAFACGKYDGHVYAVDGYTGFPTQDEFGDEFIKMMYRLHDQGFRVRAVTFDKLRGYGSGDDSMGKWLRGLLAKHPDLPIPTIDALERTREKWDKILGTAWAWQQGYVHVLEGIPGSDALYYQMQRIYYADHEDEADAFSDAFHKNWSTYSAMDPRRQKNQADWRPLPAVHGHYDRITGAFRAVRAPRMTGVSKKGPGWR